MCTHTLAHSHACTHMHAHIHSFSLCSLYWLLCPNLKAASSTGKSLGSLSHSFLGRPTLTIAYSARQWWEPDQGCGWGRHMVPLSIHLGLCTDPHPSSQIAAGPPCIFSASAFHHLTSLPRSESLPFSSNPSIPSIPPIPPILPFLQAFLYLPLEQHPRHLSFFPFFYFSFLLWLSLAIFLIILLLLAASPAQGPVIAAAGHGL